MNHWVRTNEAFDRHYAGAPQRPNYLWCLLHAGGVAKHLGVPRFSAVEMGCAGGNGLVALEAAAAAVEQELGVGVDVHGFDGAGGMPPAEDWRDAPFIMEPGHFPMDVDALRARLTRAELHLGPVAETVPAFVPGAPVGFVAQDLDYMSSTRDALRLFDLAPEHLMPRVISYYDDVLGYPWGEANGELAANAEFNAAHPQRAIDRLQGMKWLVPRSQQANPWPEALFLVHVLDHPRYAEYEGTAISTRLDLDANSQPG